MSKFSSLILLLLFVIVTSCKSTTPTIITSKKEAEKRGGFTNERLSSTNKTNTSKTSDTNKNYRINSDVTIVESTSKKNKQNTDRSENSLANTLATEAHQYIGVKYRGGGTTKSGMDCSGLVSTVFSSQDIKLPRSSNDMSKVGKVISKKESQVGDLIFFKTNGRSVINHVGLITEVNNDEIIFIHSSVQRGVIYSSTKEPYYARTFAQINRIL